MSKKAKLWLIVSVSLLVVASVATTLFLVIFKKEPTKLILETPVVDFQKDGNQKLLISKYNPNATDYVFYIYSGDHPDRIYDYAPFTADDSQLDRYYLDVTNIFVDAKDYYFCCKLLGDGKKFENSKLSAIKKITNKKSILTPRLSLTDKMLSWTKIDNSVGYKLRINGVDQNNIIESESVDISSYLMQTSAKELTFSVQSIGKEFYYDSEFSNLVTYTKKYTLSKVEDLSFNSMNNTLSWKKVENASSYEIIFNDDQVLTTTSANYSFSSYITDVGVYKFKVRAIGKDNYITGEYSETKHVEIKKKLASVREDSINWTVEDERIRISWEKPENAENYTVKINGELFNDSLTLETIYIKKPSGSQILIEIFVNGYGYYEKSNVTIKQINL